MSPLRIWVCCGLLVVTWSSKTLRYYDLIHIPKTAGTSAKRDAHKVGAGVLETGEVALYAKIQRYGQKAMPPEHRYPGTTVIDSILPKLLPFA